MSHAADLLQPWTPTAADPFDRRQAAHLVRRCGFGATTAELDALVALGPQGAVARLADAAAEPPAFAEAVALLPLVLASDDLDQVRAFWVLRLLRTRAPLGEKLALFWHGHFATSNRKVQRPRWMLGQLELFWRLGRGRFAPLLQAISRDPAMLRWLDGDSNRKGQPNENYARELFELFALGRGHYREADVREAARAFTGAQVQGESFRFDRAAHDDGDKTVLGQTGRFGGGEVVDLVTAQDACPHWLAARLLRWFVTPAPAAALVAALAQRLRALDLDVGAAVVEVLGSRAFFARAHWRSKVKSPVEFVLGAARQLGIVASPRRAAQAIGQLGQELLEPPGVNGWAGERAWINSATWIRRSNHAFRLVHEGGLGALPARGFWRDVAAQPEALVAATVAHLLDGVADADTWTALRAAARTPGDARVATVLHAALTAPEYHLA